MFERFFSKGKKKPKPAESSGLFPTASADAPPEVTVLHLILEQALSDRATEVLLQFDRMRNDFAVYFKTERGFEEVLSPPPSLFEKMKALLAEVACLSLPEDDGIFILPRSDGGGHLRFSISVEDEGATMALAPVGFC